MIYRGLEKHLTGEQSKQWLLDCRYGHYMFWVSKFLKSLLMSFKFKRLPRCNVVQVLGTSAGGSEEIVDDKVTGLLHPIGHEGIRPLALNLQFLLSNPTARKQLGSNGRLKVEKMYLKHHMYKKLAKIFAKCMKIK